MRGIDPPSIADGAVLSAVSREYPSVTLFRLQIRAAYVEYVAKKCLDLGPIELSTETVRDLGLAYESGAIRAKLRWIAELRGGHSYNFCPICGGPGVGTIDHHLPQKHFPEFSVFSYNLIPCCSACNSKRRDSNRPGEEWTLHPVFNADLLDRATLVVRIAPPWEIPSFSWDLEEGLDEEDRRKVRQHLRRSISPAIFGSWMRGQWSDLLAVRAPQFNCGTDFRASLMRELAGHDSHNRNGWSVALLRGVVDAEGLCEWIVDNANHR